MGPHPMFVDDKIMVEVRYLIRQADENSVITASVFIGNGDIVKEPISIKTIERLFTHLKETLGFITNSRPMIASYPEYKRASLLVLIQSSEWEPKYSHQVRLLDKILGNICHLAQILSFGKHLSIHLQFCLLRFIHTHICRTKSFSLMKRILRAACNPRRSVWIIYSIARDL